MAGCPLSELPRNRVKTTNIFEPDDAVQSIPDDATIAFAASGGGLVEPDALCQAMRRRFERDGHPRNLTLIHALGIGDGQSRGLNAFGVPGMVRRIIGGHWSWAPPLQQLAETGAVEAHVWPAGVISTWLRELGACRPGLITKTGLDTFVDPDETPDAMVERVILGSDTYLWYRPLDVDVAIVRASRADTAGNLVFDREAAKLDVLAAAQAAAANDGTVIAQVEEVVAAGELDPRTVHVPGLLVDSVVPVVDQWQTYAGKYDPTLSGERRTIDISFPETDHLAKRVVARRAAREVRDGETIAVGFGASADVVNVLAAQGRLNRVTICIEQGHIGGVPEAGDLFGAARNSQAILSSTDTFDMISGGVLDLALLGMGETDVSGAINVSHLGSVVGPGGFIDIAQNAGRLVFCATFTTKGLRLSLANGGLCIDSEGHIQKFVNVVQAATLRTASPVCRATSVTWVTERAVLEFVDGRIELTEVAPGVSVNDDILAHMGFAPRVTSPRTMDASLFQA